MKHLYVSMGHRFTTIVSLVQWVDDDSGDVIQLAKEGDRERGGSESDAHPQRGAYRLIVQLKWFPLALCGSDNIIQGEGKIFIGCVPPLNEP